MESDTCGQPPVEQPRCAFFIKTKNRKCTVFARPKSDFCTVHQPQPAPDSDDFRLPCPFGKHTVKRCDMERHLRLCPDGQHRPELHFAFSKDVNKCLSVPQPEASTERVAASAPTTVRAGMVERLQSVQVPWESVNRRLEAEAMADSDAVRRLRSFIAEGKLGGAKHSAQRECLVRVIDGMVRSLPASEAFGFVEFGAGKAGLSLALRVAYPDAPIVIVDRDRFRDCKDKIIKREDMGAGDVTRVKMDVSDFDFTRYMEHCERLPPTECSYGHVRRWFAVGKHLCGGCTDMSLRCVEKALPWFSGVCIATCCHHRCSADTFFGDVSAIGEGPSPSTDFEDLCKVASWATSGDSADKAKVSAGAAIKAAVDAERLRSMQRLFPNAFATRYIDESVSPENLAICGFRFPQV